MLLLLINRTKNVNKTPFVCVLELREETVNICSARGHQECSLTPRTSVCITQVSGAICYSGLKLESAAGLHEQMPPKRIRENPLLIFWSIHKAGTVPKTSPSKDVSSCVDTVYMTVELDRVPFILYFYI